MKRNLILRVLSILLSVFAIVLLGWLWKNDYKDYSFISLLLVALALVCSHFSKK